MATDNSGLIVDAITKTQPMLSLSMDVETTYRGYIQEQGARVSLFRDYERGDHRSSITTQMRKMLRLPADSSGINDFNDNYMQIVVDKMAGRLHVNEISLGDPAQDKLWLSPLLEYNHWTALQGTTFRGAIRDAHSYIMVEPETLEWTSESSFDGYSGVFAMFYNNRCTPYWACRLWSEATDLDQKETMRVVVYEENKVSYWRGQENGTEVVPDNRFTLNDIAMPGVKMEVPAGTDMANTFVNYRPWPVSMVPVIHFVNKYDNYSDTGESELRPAISLQDVLNRTLHSMVMASEFSAFNILWAKGIALDVDGIVPGAVINLIAKDSETGKPLDPTPDVTAFISAVQVGQFQGSDISQYTNQIDKIVREISQATQTPIYGVNTQGAISGDALKQLEIGLIGKVERFQNQNTDAIRDLIKLTAEMQTTFQTGYVGAPAPKIDTIAVTWKSPEILDVTAQINSLVLMRRDAPGLWSDDWYRAKIGGLLGLNQSDIKTASDEAKDEKQAGIDEVVGGGDSGTPTLV